MGERRHLAVQCLGFNEADPGSACQVTTVETPKPGPEQVLVKMLCRPINPSDVLSLQGKYGGGPSTFPFIAGYEGVGQIHELGDKVTGFQQGQRVFVSSELGGTWQEYLLSSAKTLTPIPDDLPSDVAAQFFVNPWTAYCMLEELQVPQGEYVLQTAAASVLGRLFIQLARHKGIKTINIVRRNEQKDELKALGANEVINSKEEDVVELVKKITNEKMAYGAVDAVGGGSTKIVCSSLRNEGVALVYGLLDGSDAEVDVNDLVFRNIKVHGFHLAKWLERRSRTDPETFPKIASTIMELLSKRVMTPLIGEKFPLNQVSQAIEKSQAGGRGGKVLLVSE